MEFAVDMLLVAQAALAALIAARLAWLAVRLPGAALAQPMLLVACIVVALLSALSLLISHRRSRRLRSAIARNQALQIEVDTDPLTGLGNRRSFDNAMAHAFSRAVRDGRGLSLIVIDIDHFKAFNDSYGHVEGDRVLRATARAIQEVLAADTRAYRIGGEELAVILFATALADAAQHARLIQGAVDIMRQPHRHGVGGIVTVSIGVAEGFPAAAPMVPETLIAAADRALYEAKAAGRACVRLATIAHRPPTRMDARDDDGECVDGLDIHLPNGSKLKINSRLRLSTVSTILSMVSRGEAPEAGSAQ